MLVVKKMTCVGQVVRRLLKSDPGSRLLISGRRIVPISAFAGHAMTHVANARYFVMLFVTVRCERRQSRVAWMK
jgi:hypothetical protein